MGLEAIAFLILGILVVILLVMLTPIVVLSALLTPGKAIWVVAFIMAKKLKWIDCSWWWILLGLLIPF